MGVVTELGAGVDASWLGRRVTGDTMLGCGRCRLCRSGRAHVCAEREEVGIRRGRPGALAERIAVPASSLHALPDEVDDVLGALVEPAGNALRAAQAALSLASGTRAERVLVVGPGTIGLLAAMFVRAAGADVHLVGVSEASVQFARALGFTAWLGWDAVPDTPFDAVIDAATDASTAARAVFTQSDAPAADVDDPAEAVVEALADEVPAEPDEDESLPLLPHAATVPDRPASTATSARPFDVRICFSLLPSDLSRRVATSERTEPSPSDSRTANHRIPTAERRSTRRRTWACRPVPAAPSRPLGDRGGS